MSEERVIVEHHPNWRTAIPIMLFLSGQTLLGVIWGATLTEKVDGLTNGRQDVLQKIATETAQREREMSAEKTERAAADRRLWDRIQEQERTLQGVVANERATQAILESVKEDVGAIRQEIREQNELFRRAILGEGVN